MIILDATTKSLQIKLSGAVTTNQLPFAASYIDSTGTATTPGEQDGASNNTTAVTVVGAPAASTQRLVKNLIIQNADTAAATVMVIYNNNATLRNVFVATLAVGDQLIYEDGNGWVSVDKNGNIKTSSGGGGAVTSVSNSDGTLAISPTTGGVVASLAALSSGKLLVGNGSNIATGVTMSGDATLANTGAITIANNAVTNAKAGQMAANTIKGNNTGSTANAADLTVAQVLTMLGLSVAYNAIAGCLITSLAGTHTTASATITAGQAADSTNAAYITSAGYSWAASNGNAINGTDAASSTLANSTTYHMFLCSGGSGTGTFCSASLTPTFPSGYNTYSRRIGSFNTNGSGAPIPYTSIEAEGGATINWLTTQVLDINTSTLGTTGTLFTLSTPSGVKMQPLGRSNSPSGSYVIYTSPDETDVAPSTSDNYSGAAPGYDVTRAGASVSNSPQPFLTTNTSSQIRARSSGASTTLVWVTRGWKDFRRS